MATSSESQSIATINLLPWPIDAIRERFCERDTLFQLCRPKLEIDASRAPREHILERVIIDVLHECFSPSRVRHVRSLAETLAIRDSGYFGTCRVDVALSHGDRWHLCEVKSARFGYGRTHKVMGKKLSKWFDQNGFPCASLHEVEQDFVKLLHFAAISPSVGSCLSCWWNPMWKRPEHGLRGFRRSTRSCASRRHRGCARRLRRSSRQRLCFPFVRRR